MGIDLIRCIGEVAALVVLCLVSYYVIFKPSNGRRG